MNTPSIVFSIVLVCVSQQTSGDDPWTTVSLKNEVSEIDFSAKVLQGNWKLSEGLRIDDVSDLDKLPTSKKRLAQILAKQLKQQGVRSTADFTLVRTGASLDTVTVRVFIFENSKKCRAWWQKKYEARGWEEHFEKIESDGATVVRSVEANKFAIAFGNVCLTTLQLKKGKENITAANHILKQLTGGKRSLTMR